VQQDGLPVVFTKCTCVPSAKHERLVSADGALISFLTEQCMFNNDGKTSGKFLFAQYTAHVGKTSIAPLKRDDFFAKLHTICCWRKFPKLVFFGIQMKDEDLTEDDEPPKPRTVLMLLSWPTFVFRNPKSPKQWILCKSCPRHVFATHCLKIFNTRLWQLVVKTQF
jgi:hypothetical protein